MDRADPRHDEAHTPRREHRRGFRRAHAPAISREIESAASQITVQGAGIVIPQHVKDELTGLRGEGYRRMIALCPVGRAATPDEVGAVGALLMGPDGAFITGSDSSWMAASPRPTGTANSPRNSRVWKVCRGRPTRRKPAARRRSMMQGTILYGARDVRCEEVPEPKILRPTDAIIRLSASCICGSDLWPYPRPERGHIAAGDGA